MRDMKFWGLTTLVVFLDQFIKYFVDTHMTVHQSIPVVHSVLYFTYVQNFGAAFGMLSGKQGLLIVFTFIAFIFILLFHKTMGDDPLLRWALPLLIGGAIGNLVDRLRLGYVVDYVDFIVWPTFNLADMCIVVGVGLMILQMIRKSKEEEINS